MTWVKEARIALSVCSGNASGAASATATRGLPMLRHASLAPLSVGRALAQQPLQVDQGLNCATCHRGLDHPPMGDALYGATSYSGAVRPQMNGPLEHARCAKAGHLGLLRLGVTGTVQTPTSLSSAPGTGPPRNPPATSDAPHLVFRSRCPESSVAPAAYRAVSSGRGGRRCGRLSSVSVVPRTPVSSPTYGQRAPCSLPWFARSSPFANPVARRHPARGRGQAIEGCTHDGRRGRRPAVRGG